MRHSHRLENRARRRIDPRRPTTFLLLVCVALGGSTGIARAQQGGTTQAAAVASPPSVALSPSIVMLKGQPGQSTTQTLTMTNLTEREFAFDLVAQDVVVRDGKRVFAPAGETPRGIAATAVFNPRSVVIKPHESGSSDVTLTVPTGTPVRAVVAIFRSATRMQVAGGVGMTASLGTLLTFSLSDNYQVQGTPVEIQPQTATANASFRTWLTNSGTEPVVPEGVVAVLTEGGKLVGKAIIEGQRLLPGERLMFVGDYPAQLQRGRYRFVTSFQYEGKALSLPGTFSVE